MDSPKMIYCRVIVLHTVYRHLFFQKGVSQRQRQVASALNPLDMSGHQVTKRVRGGLAWPGTPGWTHRSCFECTVLPKKEDPKNIQNGPKMDEKSDWTSSRISRNWVTPFWERGDDLSYSYACPVKLLFPTIQTACKNCICSQLFLLFCSQFCCQDCIKFSFLDI